MKESKFPSSKLFNQLEQSKTYPRKAKVSTQEKKRCLANNFFFGVSNTQRRDR